MPSRRRNTPRCSYRYRDQDNKQCGGNGIGVPPFCERHFEHILDDFEEAAETRDVGSLFVSLLDHQAIRGVLDVVGQYIDKAARNTPPVAPPGSGYYTEHPKREAEPTPPPPRSSEDPRVVLGFAAGQPLTRSSIKARRNELASLFHPDKGGSDASMQRVNLAVDELLSQLP